MLPRVSCICPTYARAWLLEEAIESFLRQDYRGEKELIVLNDFHLQVLQFTHPEVRVINSPSRFATLGEKRHYAYTASTGDFCLTWGDDDVHLPSRIGRMVDFVLANGGQFALEGPHYCLYDERMTRKDHSTVGAHIISRELYERSGGIPEVTTAEDLQFNTVVERIIGRLPVCKQEPQFIYRWSSGRPHISAVSASKEHRDRPWDRMREVSEEMVKKGKEPSGVVKLKPQWRRDWEAMANAA